MSYDSCCSLYLQKKYHDNDVAFFLILAIIIILFHSFAFHRLLHLYKISAKICKNVLRMYFQSNHHSFLSAVTLEENPKVCLFVAYE